jgi:hypothetical protein
MIADTQCPYCEKDVEINHDDGQGYSEDETHTQECAHCGMTFTYTTAIIYYYEPAKAPCQNGEEHSLEQIKGCPSELFVAKMRCKWCSEEFIVDQEAHDKARKAYFEKLRIKSEEALAFATRR